MEGNLTEFPEPQPVDKHLIAQMLVLKTIWKLSFLFALVPIAAGFILLSSYPTPIAFGLFLGGGWTILSRILPTEISGGLSPYPTDLIHSLNDFRLESGKCCENSEIQWEVAAVRCKNCHHLHLNAARPDLGRRRSDGFIGKIRLMMLDGHPLVTDKNEE